MRRGSRGIQRGDSVTGDLRETVLRAGGWRRFTTAAAPPFEADALAEQTSRHRADTPEKRLWAAVLLSALRDLATTASRSGQRARGMRRDAEEWLAEDSPEPGGFGFVCEALGLEPNRARSEILSGLGGRAAA